MRQQVTKIQYLLLMCALIVFISRCSKDEGEKSTGTISGISPESGGKGTQVTIIGTGFSASAADNIVKFNGKDAKVISAIPTQLVVEVPDAAGTGAVTVQTGGKTIEGPTFTYLEGQVTKKYYLKFKANGVWKVFETDEPGYSVCGECSCSYLPPLNDVTYAGIEICQAENNWVTAANIQNWNQKTIPFVGSTFPIAHFGFSENKVDQESGFTTDQTGSSVKVTKVEADGSFQGHPAYKVTGTFQCKVAKSGGQAISITEGSFVVRFTEDY